RRPHHISNVYPGKIQGVALHSVEAIDEKNNSVTFKVIEGDLMEEYKNIKITVRATPMGEGSLVHWTLEYEKLHENIIEPNTLLQLELDLSKDLDAHLVEADVEIKAPAEKFHELFSCRPHHISNVSPGKVQGCALHEGDWGKEGSVIFWDYVHDGKAKVAKEIIEAIDEKNNSITFKVIEGDMLQEYKSLKATVKATAKGEGSLVHWTMEYEKLNESIPEPNSLLQFVLDLSKDLDSHLTQA
ncbi:mlp-like protein 28, partial [Quercus suber]